MPWKKSCQESIFDPFQLQQKACIGAIGTYWYILVLLVHIGTIGTYWHILVHIGTCRGGGGQLLHQGDHPPERDLSASLTLGT